jgi:hypothetical protein
LVLEMLVDRSSRNDVAPDRDSQSATKTRDKPTNRRVCMTAVEIKRRTLKFASAGTLDCVMPS